MMRRKVSMYAAKCLPHVSCKYHWLQSSAEQTYVLILIGINTEEGVDGDGERWNEGNRKRDANGV